MQSSMRSRLSQLAFRIGVVALLGMLFLLYDTFFTVTEGESAIVTRFGRPIQEISNAGPYWKLPAPIDQVHVISRRRRIMVTPEAASFTQDKKNIIVTTFVVWHVERPLLFLQTVGDPEAAEASLAGMTLAAKTGTVGKHSLSSLVSTRPEDLRIQQIEAAIQLEVSAAALEKMGVAIDQVGVEHIAFPAENLAAVFNSMRAERQAEANRLRTEGEKQAQAIRDQAHIKSQEILRRGREQASHLAASAEEQATERIARVAAESAEFYRFWSALQASQRALQEKATLILSSDQLFFDGSLTPLQAGPKSPLPFTDSPLDSPNTGRTP